MKYLSEATREIEIEYGLYNSIIAPVGSGKTTYVGNKLPNELEYEGLYIYLAPYTMLRDQSIAEELFDEVTRAEVLGLEGFRIFEDDNGNNFESLEEGKVAMTTHSFLKILKSNPQIKEKIGVVIVDEDDHVFCNLPQWEINKPENKKVFKYVKDIFEELAEDVLVVGITATGEERLREIWGDKYNAITFAEELISYTPAAVEEYSDMKLVFNAAIDTGGKVAVYTQSVKSMLKQRAYFEQLGYTVDMIVSDYAKNYSMTARERSIKSELAENGSSELIGDILIFNAAMERGVSITDTSFTAVIIHSSVVDTQTQVLGRFRYDGMNVYKLLDRDNREQSHTLDYVVDGDGRVSNEFIIPEEYMEVPLTTDMKNELIKEIGFSRKWTSLSRALIEDGYTIEDKRMRIQGKQLRISIINK